MAREDDDEEYFIPLQDQRVFGAGLKRKRVQFVPSGSLSTSSDPTTVAFQKSPTTTAGSIYASIVFPNSIKTQPVNHTPNRNNPELSSSSQHGSGIAPTAKQTNSNLCDICHLPLPPSSTSYTATTIKPHEATLAHQACLTHSHPPSHLDRRHKGFQYLSSYGWDPDGRRGLGAEGEGRLFPVKSKLKNDTLGVGFQLPKEAVNNGEGKKVTKEGKKKLGAKQIRKRDEEQRRKAARLHSLFYQSEEVNRFLGVEGGLG